VAEVPLILLGDLVSPGGQERHHVVPDWMLRTAGRYEAGRIAEMPSLDTAPAICLERGGGLNGHDKAHQHTDRLAQRVARDGRSTGVPGTLQLGQAKAISARAVEKATGGAKNGGCPRQQIQQQLDEQFSAHNDTMLRGVQHAGRLPTDVLNALRGGKD
jgi:hypothetical protein